MLVNQFSDRPGRIYYVFYGRAIKLDGEDEAYVQIYLPKPDIPYSGGGAIKLDSNEESFTELSRLMSESQKRGLEILTDRSAGIWHFDGPWILIPFSQKERIRLLNEARFQGTRKVNAPVSY